MTLLFMFPEPQSSALQLEARTLLAVYNDALREIAAGPLANTTTGNASLTELNNAFPGAVGYVLSQADWNFAMRRATLYGTADTTGFPPYTYRYARPASYLRKHWIKVSAADEFPTDHAEVGAVFYGFDPTALIEYVSSATDNYDPDTWPPQFARAVSIYLAFLVAPKLARAGDDVLGPLWSRFQQTLQDAANQEAVFYTNQQIPTERLPVMRRAVEFMGQQLHGSVALYGQTDKLRWHMSKAWAHAVKYCLEQGAWNFATKRALLRDGTDGADTIASIQGDNLIEGYSVSDSSTVTISIAAPAVVSWTAHGIEAETPVAFTTTGALPTGFAVRTTYYVLTTGLTTNSFQVSETLNGAAVNTSGTQSGVHTCAVVEIEDDTSSVPDLAGYDYGHALPDDYLHKIWIKRDAFDDREISHQVVRDHIFVNEDPVVLEYIAQDDWTTDPDNWPASFLEVVAAYLALMVAPEFMIEGNPTSRKQTMVAPKIRDALEGMFQRKLSDAKTKDAIQQYPKIIPSGSFVRARAGGSWGGARRGWR